MTQTVSFTTINTTSVPQVVCALNGAFYYVASSIVTIPTAYAPPSLQNAGYTPTGVAGP